MGLEIPAIRTQSKTKRTQFEAFRAQMPKDIEIKFTDPNNNGKLDPKEWIEYEQGGQRIVGYSPFGNKTSTDTPATIAKRLGVAEDVISSQTGKTINPNSFLRLVLPKKAETASQTQQTTQPPQPKTPTTRITDEKFEGTDSLGVHVVKKGENFAKLASKLNTTTEEMKTLSNHPDNDLQIGDKITYYETRRVRVFDDSIPDAVYKDALKSYLKGEFKGHEAEILAAAKRYKVPVSDMVAIMMHETGNGTSSRFKNHHNPGGMRDKKGNFATFANINSGINAMAKRLRNDYYKRGLDTLDEIQPQYCPTSDTTDTSGLNKNWLPSTTKKKAEFLTALSAAQSKNKTE